MSILTKIFVVLTTILAVLLVPLMIAYVTNTNHYQQELNTSKQLLAVAEHRARMLDAEQTNRQMAEAQKVADLQATVQRVQSQLDQKLSDISRLESQLVTREDELARARADLSIELSKSQQAQNFVDKMNEEVLKRRSEAVEAQRDLLALSDQLQERTANLESMNEQVRLLREQLADMENQLAEAKRQQLEGVRPTVATATTVPTLAVPVRGIITDVQTVGEETFVAINLGTNDQVAQGMQFIIHDNGQFVASMEVTKADLNASAGRVTLLRGEVTRNLKVMSSDF